MQEASYEGMVCSREDLGFPGLLTLLEVRNDGRDLSP